MLLSEAEKRTFRPPFTWSEASARIEELELLSATVAWHSSQVYAYGAPRCVACTGESGAPAAPSLPSTAMR